MIQLLRRIFAFQATPDSDEYGIALAGYVIMWVGAILTAFTGLQQLFAIAMHYGAKSDTMTIYMLFQLALSLAIFLMGAALTFWYKNKYGGKVNVRREVHSAP